MDEPTIAHAKTTHGDVDVHQLPGGEQPIHSEYGLRILFVARDRSSTPTDLKHPRYFEFYGFSHLTSGKGWYWTPKGTQTFEAGQGVISTPGFIQRYGGRDTEYIEDAIGFAGALADCLFKQGIIRDGILDIGKTRRLLPIIELASDPAVTSQLRANIALQELLIQLNIENQSESQSSNDQRIRRLLEVIHSRPRKWWTVGEMAELCNLSQTQFRRIFSASTGMAPKQYVDNVRIQKAAERLCSSRDPIATVANAFGYRDEYHFSRRFKTMTGLPPSVYRRKYSLSS